jgi:hypothetical protein
MPFTTTAKNLMLNGVTYAYASLHDGFPGQAGLNEITGSPYSRQPVAVGSASGEQRTMSGSLTFPVPAKTIRWIGYWSSTGQFLAYSANGGAPFEFVIDLTANTIISPAHGIANGSKVVFYDGTVPAPLIEGTIYFVVNSAANTFQIAATAGGTPIVLTDYGTSECQVSTMVEDVFTAPGAENVAAASFALNL